MKDYEKTIHMAVQANNKKDLSYKLAEWLKKRPIWFYPDNIVNDLLDPNCIKRKKKLKKLIKQTIGQDSNGNAWKITISPSFQAVIYDANYIKPRWDGYYTRSRIYFEKCTAYRVK